MEGITVRQLVDLLMDLSPEMRVVLGARPMELTDVIVAEGYVGPQFIRSERVGQDPAHFTVMVYIGEEG